MLAAIGIIICSKQVRTLKEQLVVFVATAAITIATDLLVGVVAGIAVEMFIHVLHGAPLRSLFRPEIEEHVEGGRLVLRVKQAAVFSNYLSIKRRLARHRDVRAIEINFAATRLVDHTVMANLHDPQGPDRARGPDALAVGPRRPRPDVVAPALRAEEGGLRNGGEPVSR
ncbi:hypothetical protein WME76_18390 [Sorangium sp. So ce119]|uniref:hypothetical protein n=1 Tax=Sorangium sp. So ce119 TaxID=3133279 RepID=UPI003F5E2875